MGTDNTTEVERETVVAAAPDRVWATLGGMLGEQTLLDPVEGGLVEVREDDRLLTGEVLEADPPRRLVLRWWDGRRDSLVEIDLEPVPDGTRVRVRERLLEPVSATHLWLLPAPAAPATEPRMLAVA